MVSVQRTLLQNGLARSASTAMITSKKSAATSSMTASDPDLAKQLYKANVRLAIEDRKTGTSAKYEELREKFASPATSAIEICQYLSALSNFVTYDPSGIWLTVRRLEAPLYTSLVRAIVSLNWVGYPAALIQVYIQFLGALATAQTTYLPLILSSLLGEFADVSSLPNAKRTDLQVNAHYAIQHLLEVVPSGNTILLRLIRETFPHQTADRREQISYVFNLIRLSHYAEHIKGEILALCIERTVQIDVEIQFELDRLEDDLEDELLMTQTAGGAYSAEDDVNTEPPVLDDATETSSGILNPTTDLATLRETITTLDALMTTLFNYLDPIFAPSASYPTLEAEHLFDSLLSVFLTQILPTYHSRHAQFFLFRTSQSHPLFLDKFVCLLIERSLNPNLPNIARQASSAYLSSFIARAKALPAEMVRTVVEVLCTFLSRVLEEMPLGKFVPGGVAGNNGLDGVYAVFQAVVYIYCFRWRELREDVDEETGEQVWMPHLNVIQRMAWSGLNPLAVCHALM